jgi:hypothetical protein
MEGLSYKVISHPKYKYELTSSIRVALKHFVPGIQVEVPGGWAGLDNGDLWIASGYAWDGASGPALDTVSILRASLVHDVIYQLIAEKRIPYVPWKDFADKEFKKLTGEDNMGRMRRWYTHLAVKMFGKAKDSYQA